MHPSCPALSAQAYAAKRYPAGERVTLRLDAHPDDVFTGRVRTIGGARFTMQW